MSNAERCASGPAIAALAVFALIAFPHETLALDCQRATQLLDKVICGDSDLKAADAKMAKAYFDLLKSTKDKEVHDLIILSQRRWIDARYQQDVTDPLAKPEPNSDDLDDQKSMLLDQMKDRTRTLSAQPSTMALNIREEREFISRFSGGSFSGFRTGCFFAPKGFGDGAYICLGTQVAQNNDRICTTIQEWASGHDTEYRTVSQVVDGKAKLVAECSTGYASTDETCPDEGSPADGTQSVGWNFHLDSKDPTFDPNVQDGPSLKLDPDFPFDDISHGWTAQCLTDPNFPPQSLESPASRSQ
ncbi:lysozyme inhibitor LprI family protein [Rhizobium sp. BR 315]|uniref:lysozyme inhibitor LprI family protein n=1 Tax=Rhizobium sp. BR 315 TaxID=3040014 RepID=UPI003D3579D1